MVIGVVVHRLILTSKQRRQEKFWQQWRKIFHDGIFQRPLGRRRLSAKDTVSFMLLWNSLQETLQGESKENLNGLARSLRIDERAIKMMNSRSLSLRLLAMSTIGHLRHTSCWSQIERNVWVGNIKLAVHALQALSRIDVDRSVEVMIDFLLRSDEWPEYRIANILYEMGPASFSRAMATAVLSASQDKQVRLLTLMRYADRDVVLPLVRQLLYTSSFNEVRAACLNLIGLLGDNRDIALVKPLITAKEPIVRIRAVTAFGQLATEGDLSPLEERLSDPVWWVRYRAALAVASVPGVTIERIEHMRNAQQDPFAVDILNYALSQRGG